MKEAYYFSHDSNARQDPKILSLRADFGMEGYGVYWGIIETLREQADYKIHKDLIIGVIMNLGICNTNALQMYNKMIQMQLLVEQDDFVLSNSLLKRMQKREEISKIRRQAVLKRYKKKAKITEQNTNVLQNSTNVYQMCTIKGKERKGKEKKGKDVLVETSSTDNSYFSFNETLENWINGENRFYSLIGRYFKSRQLTFNTKEQMQTAAKRHLRAAKNISVFSDDQILEAIAKISNGNNINLQLEWTMETIFKYLTK